MKGFTRVLAMALAALLILGGLAGCGKNSSQKPDKDLSTIVAATYGSRNIYMDEANFFLRYNQWAQEASYWYLYTQYLGYPEMWSIQYDESGKTLADNIKEATMQQIHQTLVLCDAAGQYGLSMADVDEEACKKAAHDALTEINPAFFEYAPVTEEQVAEWFKENALAVLVHEAIVDGVQASVTDEECAMYEVDYVLITEDVSTANAEAEEEAGEEDAEAETATAAAEEYGKEEGAAKIAEQVNAGSDLDTVLSKYGLSSTTAHYHVQAQADEEELAVNSRALAVGEADSFWDSEKDAWCVAVRANDKDDDATETERESMLNNKKDEGFKEIYKKLESEAPEFDVASDYEELVVGGSTPIYVENETEEETVTDIPEADMVDPVEEPAEEPEALTEGTTEAETSAD